MHAIQIRVRNIEQMEFLKIHPIIKPHFTLPFFSRTSFPVSQIFLPFLKKLIYGEVPVKLRMLEIIRIARADISFRKIKFRAL